MTDDGSKTSRTGEVAPCSVRRRLIPRGQSAACCTTVAQPAQCSTSSTLTTAAERLLVGIDSRGRIGNVLAHGGTDAEPRWVLPAGPLDGAKGSESSGWETRVFSLCG
jgi:hypothetical protein